MKFIKLYMKLLVALLFAFFPGRGKCQCSQSTFSVADTVCANSPIQLSASDTSGRSFLYEFADLDFNSIPTSSQVPNSQSVSAPYTFKLFNEGVNWIGFAVGSNSSLIKYDFGDDPVNHSPVITDLGNYNGLLSSTFSIAGISEPNSKKLLVGNADNSLILIDFGSSFSNSATASNINPGNILGLSLPTSIAVVKKGTFYYAFITSYSGTGITRLSFGSSLNNPPASYTFGTVINGYSVGTTVAMHCDSNMVFATGLTNNTLYMYNFGESFSGIPSETVYTNPLIGQVINSIAVYNADSNYVFLAHYNNSSLIKLRYDQHLNTIESITDVGISTGPSIRGFDLYNYGTSLIGIGTSETDKFLYRVVYLNNAQIQPQKGPVINVSFSNTGYQKIILNAADSSGRVSRYVDSVYVLPAPSASFSITGPFCESNSISFNNTSQFIAGNITSAGWNFGDSGLGSGNTVTHSYADGTYTIILAVTNDQNSCVVFSTNTISIHKNPVAGFSSEDSLCLGSPFHFTDTSLYNGQIISRLFEFGDGNFSPDSNSIHSYSVPGPSDIKLVVTTEFGCKDSSIKTVYNKEGTIADFIVSSSCIGDSTKLESISVPSDSLNPIVSIKFEAGDNTTAFGSVIKHLYQDTGVYIVSQVVTTLNGCSDTISKGVEISMPAIPGFSLLYDSICATNPVNIINNAQTNGGTISSITYTFGNGDSLIALSPNYVYNNPGDYNITQKVKTGSACISEYSKSVFVKNSGRADFIVSDTCSNQALKFENISSPPPGFNLDSVYWNFGDPLTFNDSSRLFNPLYKYLQGAGTYQVTMNIYSSNNCVNTSSKIVTVLSSPEADFYTLNSCEGQTTSFFNNSQGNGGQISSYQWSFFGLDTLYSNQMNPMIIFDSPGMNPIQLVVNSVNGCSDTITRLITVNPKPTADFRTTPLCEGRSAWFMDSSQITFPWTIIPGSVKYSFGDGGTATSSTTTHTYADTGSYNVTYLFTASNGCRDTITKEIHVYSIPEADFVIPAICENQAATVVSSSSSIDDEISEWTWTSGFFTLGNDSVLKILSDSSGSLPLSLNVKTAHGCTDLFIDTVPIHPTPIADFTISDSRSNPPALVSFANTSSGATSYIFDFDDGSAQASGFPASHTYTDPGNYNPSVIAITPFGCRDTSSQSLLILEKYLDVAINNLSYSIVDSFLIVTAEFVNLSNSDITDLDLLLVLQDGGVIKDKLPSVMRYQGTPLVHTFSSLRVSSENLSFCVSSENPNREADMKPENNLVCRSLSQDGFQVVLYPNPVRDMVAVDISSLSDVSLKITIYDSRGRLVKTNAEIAVIKGFARHTFDVSELSKGLYSVQFHFGDTIITSKLVKE